MEAMRTLLFPLLLALPFSFACHSSPGKTSARQLGHHAGSIPDLTSYFGWEQAVYVADVRLSPSCRTALERQAEELGLSSARASEYADELCSHVESHLYDMISNTEGLVAYLDRDYAKAEASMLVGVEVHDLGIWIDRTQEDALVRSVLEETEDGAGSYWCVLTMRFAENGVQLGAEQAEGVYHQHGARSRGDGMARASTESYAGQAAAAAATELAWGELWRRVVAEAEADANAAAEDS